VPIHGHAPPEQFRRRFFLLASHHYTVKCKLCPLFNKQIVDYGEHRNYNVT
jgi:hypothetical protein